MIDYFVNKDTQESRLENHRWSVARLIELSKKLKVMKVPLEHMNMYYKYDSMTLRQLAGHIDAVNNADLNYPIILDEDGEIMDGRHRLIKAILKKKKKVKAVRFLKNPVPCRIEE